VSGMAEPGSLRVFSVRNSKDRVGSGKRTCLSWASEGRPQVAQMPPRTKPLTRQGCLLADRHA